jgi:hypothetical protein
MLMAENFKSTYIDAIVLSFLFISLGGIIAFSLFLINHTVIPTLLLIFILYQSYNFFRTTYNYNVSIDEKKHLFVTTTTLNDKQKNWFTTKMEEELSQNRKPIFWNQKKSTDVFLYLSEKISKNDPFTEDEQYILNLFLIDYLDLDQIARNWIKLK